jgi:UDP-3-O-[3-hydroxymyristoyl] glucosamine N-acyltransferase
MAQGEIMTLGELGAILGVPSVGGDNYEIKGVRDIERLAPEADLEDHYVYFIESPAVLKRHPKAAEHGAILTTPALAPHFKRALIAPEKSSRPTFFALLKHFDRRPAFAAGVAVGAHVHPNAAVDASATVMAGAVVMDGAVVGARTLLYPGVVIEPHATVAEDCILYANVVIGHHCVIGRRGIIHGGTVIGADGFGFFDEPGKRHKVPHIGNVVIADDVEIGACASIDRATIESTVIGQFTKMDDQVHIGHNCQVGRFVYVVGNTAVGGSVTIGDGAMLSGMVIVKDHLNIAPGTIVMGLSGVAQDTEAKTAYFGTPARPARQMHKMNAALERLPDLLGRVKTIEEKLLIETAAPK